MRVAPPGLLKIDREDLLAQVRERLFARAPELADALDPAHPAWLVLQEAAWMVEVMSDELDRWPWAVIQQFAHLLGASTRPARPSLGVVVVEPTAPGALALGAAPDRWRFFAPQTEDRGLVEFVLAEDDVPVVPGRVAGLARVAEGELWVAGARAPRDPGLPSACLWAGDLSRSRAFAREWFRYRISAADPDRVESELQEAVTRFAQERATGWLRLEVRRADDDVVELHALVDVAAAFEAAGSGERGDVRGTWRTLDDSTWTPPVRIAAHPVLPPNLRAQRPMRTEGGLLVPGVPANMLRHELLEREARPAPADVPAALWRTLIHLDRRLAPLEPVVSRGVDAPQGTDAGWVEAALRSGAWFMVDDWPDQTIAHVAVEALPQGGRVRFAWLRDPSAPREVRAFAVDPQHGLLSSPLEVVSVWEVSLPDPSGKGLLHVAALDVTVPPGAEGVVVATRGRARGVLLNACLVVNAPVVRDGRQVSVSRAVPEPVSLLQGDVVTREVLDGLGSGGLHPALGPVLGRCPVARVEVEGEAPLTDFQGVQVDPVEGLVTLNAPDGTGHARRLRRGATVELTWYRSTQAKAGNVAAGEIGLVEQAPFVSPRLSAVSNPLATAWGEDREEDADAIQRIFGPQTGLPVTPADWERLIRAALGGRASDWIVRVWGYAERALVSHAVWPPHGAGPADPERASLEASLETAGPEVLLVVLGPRVGVLEDAELEHARRRIRSIVAEWSDRVPAIRDAVVTRCWPLRLEGTGPGPWPRFSLADVSGRLVDPVGRTSDVPRVSMLLNAAVVEAAG